MLVFLAQEDLFDFQQRGIPPLFGKLDPKTRVQGFFYW
jgi:hypothetical protein